MLAATVLSDGGRRRLIWVLDTRFDADLLADRFICAREVTAEKIILRIEHREKQRRRSPATRLRTKPWQVQAGHIAERARMELMR